MSDLSKWIKTQALLKRIKTKEMQLRREICGNVLFGLTLPSRKKVVLDGYNIEAENKVNYSVEDAVYQAIEDELSIAEKAVIKWTPGLKLTEYKALLKQAEADEEELLLDEAITIKPTAPTLKVLGIAEEEGKL